MNTALEPQPANNEEAMLGAKPAERRGGKRPGSGRKKGTPNKSTVLREMHRFHTAEAIETLRSVCVDSSAGEMARVQAACKLIDLLPSELLRTKGALPCAHQDLTNAINGCLKTMKADGGAT